MSINNSNKIQFILWKQQIPSHLLQKKMKDLLVSILRDHGIDANCDDDVKVLEDLMIKEVQLIR